MQNIITVALNTYRQSIRSKILYTLFIFAIILVLISALFGSVTIGEQSKVIKDFGLFSISLFTVAYIVIAGSALLHKELSKKTIDSILSKAVYRWEFLIGKYFGMLLIVCIMILLMGLGLFGFSLLFDGAHNLLLFQAYYYQFLELLIICAAAIFFSSIVVTPLLSGLFTLGIFIAGRSITYLLYFVQTGDLKGFAANFLKTLNFILPNLNKLNINNEIVYGYSMNMEHMIWSSLYAISYSLVLLSLAMLFFSRREFN
ncbi:MAG: ABC transporter permease subunit [Bdellovibrionales bacterium]|nr:ABC transporter permease subunit [Bdellovibrionales bacterium]